MNTKLPWKTVHFIGVGGVGMAGLAHILLDLGLSVSGTDAQDSDYLQSLQIRSPKISTTFTNSMIDDCDLVVYSSAIDEDHPERQYAKKKNKPQMRRGELLAKIASLFPIVIGVAGSHGKTTTSAMIAHILKECGKNPGWMIGGTVSGFSRNGGVGGGEILVTEVDESDGTQALMYCTHAVITNVEDDHSWFFGGIEGLEECFKTFAKQAIHVWTWDNKHNHQLFYECPRCTFLDPHKKREKFELNIPGEVNRANACLAMAVAMNGLKINIPDVYQAISTFHGVKRRLTEQYRSPDNNFIVIEDYAHHPTEIHAAIEGVKSSHPQHRLIILFQPHRYERIKQFSSSFSKELSNCDVAIIVSPFAAWEKHVDASIDVQKVFDNIATHHGFFSDNLEDIPNYLQENQCIDPEKPTVFLLIGAGDIIKATPPLVDFLKEIFVTDCIKKMQQEFVSCEFFNDKTWSELTTIGVGTGKPWIASIQNPEDLESLCPLAQKYHLPLRVLGNGSNLIGTDHTSDILWLKLEGESFKKISISYHDIIVGAATSLHCLVKEMIEQDCCPPEMAPLACIPAQLGGALFMNASCQGSSISQQLQNFCGYLSDGTMWMQEHSEIQWGYHHTQGIMPDMIITSLILRRGAKGAQVEAEKRYQEACQYRAKSQPIGRSAGCIFRNPEIGPSAGAIIEQCGLRGVHIGNCFISREHANFLMAKPQTSSLEFAEFVLQVQRRVFIKSGVVLELEVDFIGKEEKSLLQKQLTLLRYEETRLS